MANPSTDNKTKAAPPNERASAKLREILGPTSYESRLTELRKALKVQKGQRGSISFSESAEKERLPELVNKSITFAIPAGEQFSYTYARFGRDAGGAYRATSDNAFTRNTISQEWGQMKFGLRKGKTFTDADGQKMTQYSVELGYDFVGAVKLTSSSGKHFVVYSHIQSKAEAPKATPAKDVEPSIAPLPKLATSQAVPTISSRSTPVTKRNLDSTAPPPTEFSILERESPETLVSASSLRADKVSQAPEIKSLPKARLPRKKSVVASSQAPAAQNVPTIDLPPPADAPDDSLHAPKIEAAELELRRHIPTSNGSDIQLDRLNPPPLEIPETPVSPAATRAEHRSSPPLAAVGTTKIHRKQSPQQPLLASSRMEIPAPPPSEPSEETLQPRDISIERQLNRPEQPSTAAAISLPSLKTPHVTSLSKPERATERDIPSLSSPRSDRQRSELSISAPELGGIIGGDTLFSSSAASTVEHSLVPRSDSGSLIRLGKDGTYQHIGRNPARYLNEDVICVESIAEELEAQLVAGKTPSIGDTYREGLRNGMRGVYLGRSLEGQTIFDHDALSAGLWRQNSSSEIGELAPKPDHQQWSQVEVLAAAYSRLPQGGSWVPLYIKESTQSVLLIQDDTQALLHASLGEPRAGFSLFAELKRDAAGCLIARNSGVSRVIFDPESLYEQFGK